MLKYTRFSDSNDGLAFTTTTTKESKRGKGKKKAVTCYKCNKTGHY